MTQMVSAERVAALRNKCLNLTKTCRLGSGSASERTSQSRQLMSPAGISRHFRCAPEFGRYRGMADIDQAAPVKLD
jgi:hypothetical protein